MSESHRDEGSSRGDPSLGQHALELYRDLRLTPLLRQLVRTSCRVADAVGGSISMVDVQAGRYTKVAEIGTACGLGQTFSMHDGVTGQVMKRREPVLLDSYREIPRGHLAAGHPAWDGAVAAFPIWWRSDIVAVNVIFVGVERSFAAREVDSLEVMTQIVAPGLVTAMDREFPHPGPDRASHSAPGAGSVEEVALGLVELAERATHDQRVGPSHLQVTLVRGDRPRLLVREEPAPAADGPARAAGQDFWRELLDQPDGTLAVRRVTRDGLPVNGSSSSALGYLDSPAPEGCPFSSREQQVARLLARGLSDRAVADELCLSSKTVEKHVGAVLRKTGTTSRTGAVVRCMDMGWL